MWGSWLKVGRPRSLFLYAPLGDDRDFCDAAAFSCRPLVVQLSEWEDLSVGIEVDS